MANLLDACERNLTEVVKSLLEAEGVEVDARDETYQRTALHFACVNGNMELAMALVDRGVDVDARDVNQGTPLHYACINGNMELAMALVDRGADVDARDVNQCTPLHYACDKGNMEVAMALVDRGADVDARDVNQGTPLHYACDRGNMELAMALVDRGADIDARSVDQYTPLHDACRNGYIELAMALVKKGANVYSVNSDGNKPRCTPAMIDLFNRLWYTTPLMKAMLDRDMDTFEALLNDESVEVNAEIGDGYGWTVLHAAVDMRLGEYVTRLLQHDRVDNTAKHAPRSQTALHIACSKGDVAMVRLFVVI